MQIVKQKSKTKKQKDLMQKLRDLNDSVRNAVLKKYLDKCKHENAIKFFEWRKEILKRNLDKDQ